MRVKLKSYALMLGHGFEERLWQERRAGVAHASCGTVWIASNVDSNRP